MNFKQVTQSRTGAVIAGATVLVTLGGIGGAVAAGQINSRDIKNDSIRSVDVKDGTLSGADVENGSIGMRDLNGYTKSQIRGEAGEQGPRGPQGPEGPAGPAGTANYAGPNWSIVDRNVIGNGDAYLRSGPASENFGASVKPPLGIGSLGLRTGSGDDKVAFGNQVDFVGDAFGELATLKYSIYTTGENGVGNLPNLQFEIDPEINNTTGAAINFTTATHVPASSDANKWTEVDASTGARWYLTGTAGTVTGCNQTTYCTLAELQAKVPNATIYTTQFSKGRDAAFTGAVDKLVVNTTTYDFEPFGVTTK